MSNSTELLRNKKVVVIGGSSGIGRSVAAAALAHHASVVVASSSQDRVDAAVASLKGGATNKTEASVSGQALDLKNFDALKLFLTKEGPFDHLVITAGNLPENLNFPSQEIGEDIKDHFEIRYWATIVAAQHIHKNKLIKPSGSITLTIGTSQKRPLPGWSLVTGVLGSVESSTRGLAVDLKPIRVNTISPGLVDTDLFAKTPAEDRERLYQSRREALLVGHVASPDEVAEAYIFAMKCTYLTGQVITVDGGGSLV